MVQSTRPHSADKAEVLTVHAGRGLWCKTFRINGRKKFVYLGKVADDPEGTAALEEWKRTAEYHKRGEKPPAAGEKPLDVVTVLYCCNAFLTFKKNRLAAGELAQRTYDYLKHVGTVVADVLGRDRAVADLKPIDFEGLYSYMVKKWGAVRRANMVGCVRAIFRYGVEAGIIPALPVFGPGFKKPSAKTLRKLREDKGPQMFAAADLKAIIDKATVNGKAMLLLGINGGFSNADVALLPLRALDLDRGWLTFARTKTGIPRRIPLWQETVDALRAVLKARREPTDPADANLVFIARRGENYHAGGKGTRVAQEYNRAAKLAGIEGRTFYDLRRTLETIGEDVRDLAAVQSLMGHAPPANDMSARYRQKMTDDRLLAVANHVRGWLYGTAEGGAV